MGKIQILMVSYFEEVIRLTSIFENSKDGLSRIVLFSVILLIFLKSYNIFTHLHQTGRIFSQLGET